uniref:Rhomboid-related protein 4 n=2 Tax=Cacopsylla melanoneura TaxID=428564 RepID=A0A8D8SZ85_9HEMI
MARPRTYELGLILLLVQILHLGADSIPPVTLGLVLIHTLLYMNIIAKPWSALDVCISAKTVWQDKEWKRIILSAFEHGDDMHLYYNMVSLILKGRLLERIFGPIKFIALILFLTIFTSIYYVVLSYGMSVLTNDPTELTHCAIGFSAVLFAMKTILTRQNPDTYQSILNVEVKATYAPWFELFIIHVLVPNASFKGHLSGILVGLTYTDTPIGWALDYVVDQLYNVSQHDRIDTGEK